MIGIEKFVELSRVTTARPDFVQGMCRVYGRAVSEKILALYASSSAGGSVPSDEQFYGHAAESGTRCWHGGVAYAHDLHRRGSGSASGAMLQLILGFAQIGLSGNFEVDLPYSDWFLLESNRFRCSGPVRILASQDRVEIDCTDDRFTFERVDGLWRRPDDSDPGVGWSRGRHYVYCSGYRVDPEVILAEDRALESANIPAAHRSIDLAISNLETAGDDYLAWSTRLIRQLTLVSSEAGARLSSRSVSARIGNVELAAPGNDQHLAELLVHEAAHQHYYLAQLFSPLVRAEAAGLSFYSAINGLNRPLDRVALAYHAVVNIFGLLDALTRCPGPIAESSRNRMDELAFTENSLRETLTANRDKLTEFGLAFCEAMIADGLDMISRHQVDIREFGRGKIRGVG
jgi:hypothetical protein